ncbi:MAG TPA: hypothetical protein VF158_09900 [Longimicrobiales bacterium]
MTTRSWLAVVVGSVAAGCAALRLDREPDPAERLAEGLAALERGDYRGAYEPLSWVYTRYAGEAIGQQALLVLAAAEMDPRNPSRRLAVGAELAGRYLRMRGIAPWTEPVAETMYLLALELGAAEQRAAEAEEEEAEARAEAREARTQAREARTEAREARTEAREARAEAERERAQAEEAQAEARRARAQAEQARAETRRAQAGAQAAPAGAQAAPQDLPQLPGPPVTARMRELEQARTSATTRAGQLEGELAACQRELARVRRAAGL